LRPNPNIGTNTPKANVEPADEPEDAVSDGVVKRVIAVATATTV
jgi:hypothetical protein